MIVIDLAFLTLHNHFAGVGVRPESPPKRGADDSYEGLPLRGSYLLLLRYSLSTTFPPPT